MPTIEIGVGAPEVVEIGVSSAVYCIGSGYAAAHGGESSRRESVEFACTNFVARCCHGVHLVGDRDSFADACEYVESP